MWRATVASFIVLATALNAQQSPAEEPAALLAADMQRRAAWAAEWLRSEDPKRVAWGAYLVRVDRLTDLIPQLIQKVAAYRSSSQVPLSGQERDPHDALLVVLDTLVELRATVPVEDARKLYPEFYAQAVILLVRSPEPSERALFEIFDQAKANWTWLAVGNVLRQKYAAGFAARLLSQFTQHISVAVRDAGDTRGIGPGSGSECGLFSWGRPKQGWPPVGMYQLTQLAWRIPWLPNTFLVDGEAPVHYWRAEPGSYNNWSDGRGTCDDGDRDQYRAQYLRSLMQFYLPNVDLESHREMHLTWEGEASYRRQIGVIVEEDRASFRRSVSVLQQSGRLTAVEAAVQQPRIEIVLRDYRKDQSTAVPAVFEGDPGVKFRREPGEARP